MLQVIIQQPQQQAAQQALGQVIQTQDGQTIIYQPVQAPTATDVNGQTQTIQLQTSGRRGCHCGYKGVCLGGGVTASITGCVCRWGCRCKSEGGGVIMKVGVSLRLWRSTSD